MDDETMGPAARAMLTGSVLEPYVSQYCDHLRDGRYAAQTRRAYVSCVAHFAHWVTAERLVLEGADEEAGRRFVVGHLPAATARSRSGGDRTRSGRPCRICTGS